MLKRCSVLPLLLGVSLLGSGVLVGCGQKGPLYLPAKSQSASSQASKTNEPAPVESVKSGSEQDKPVKDTGTATE